LTIADPALIGRHVRREILADSPLSYWPLTESSGNAVDVVAARNGTITGSVTRPSSSTMGDGAGAGFTGSGQRINIADDAVWDYSGAWTSECFARLTSLPSPLSAAAFCREGSTGSTQRWAIGSSNGNKPTGYTANGSTYKILTGPTDWPTGQWCHIAIVSESGGTLRLYFNGTQVASTTGAVTAASAEQLTIGSSSVNTGLWPGAVAHCAVYTSALSAARIAAHAAAGR
jgi:hypothetical protein